MSDEMPIEAEHVYHMIYGMFFDRLTKNGFTFQPGAYGTSFTVENNKNKWICYLSIGAREKKILIRNHEDNSPKAENWKVIDDMRCIYDLHDSLEEAIDIVLPPDPPINSNSSFYGI